MRIGFRTWSLLDQQETFAFQSAVMFGHIWDLMGPNQAYDYGREAGILPLGNLRGLDRHPAQPAPGNMVGLYHYYDSKRAEQVYGRRNGFLGACMCWGRIGGKDGEGMFRSEFAQIVVVTEPQWDAFDKPPPPPIPRTISDKLWMTAVTKQRANLLGTREAFQRYVEALAQVVGMDSATLRVDDMYSQLQAKRAVVDDGYAAYLRLIEEWERKLASWDEDHSTRFRASMPFPVVQTADELVAYAQKFGDLGPPNRS